MTKWTSGYTHEELEERGRTKPKRIDKKLGNVCYRVPRRQQHALTGVVSADDARALLICAACRRLDGPPGAAGPSGGP